MDINELYVHWEKGRQHELVEAYLLSTTIPSTTKRDKSAFGGY